MTSYAWGPRARASLGADFTLLRLSHSRLGTRALLAFEDADEKRFFPADVGRAAIEIGFAWPLAALSKRRALELGVSIGRETAFSLEGFVLRDRFHSDDVPFGAGGWYSKGDVAFRSAVGSDWLVSTRVGLHLYTNLFPALVGARDASDVVADHLREGAELKTTFELGVRYMKSACYQPLARVYLDSIAPHDDSAHPLWLGRLLLAVALPREALEFQPFFDAEAGHGSGLLVNRNQLRFGAGVRLHAK
ncbi:MAG TPA: hypothetical protein VFQ35_13275 [Polyangiaceae bacterium]|nr:hypothetical protein [Polyangiaceae bacterium]